MPLSVDLGHAIFTFPASLWVRNRVGHPGAIKVGPSVAQIAAHHVVYGIGTIALTAIMIPFRIVVGIHS